MFSGNQITLQGNDTASIRCVRDLAEGETPKEEDTDGDYGDGGGLN